jgi:hypothetical protein
MNQRGIRDPTANAWGKQCKLDCKRGKESGTTTCGDSPGLYREYPKFQIARWYRCGLKIPVEQGSREEEEYGLWEGTYRWRKASKSKSTSGSLEPTSTSDRDGDGTWKIGGESGR